jgi:hypothetical protein
MSLLLQRSVSGDLDFIFEWKEWIEFLQNSGIRPTTYRQNITPIDGLRLPHKEGQLTISSKLLGKWAVKDGVGVSWPRP